MFKDITCIEERSLSILRIQLSCLVKTSDTPHDYCQGNVLLNYIDIDRRELTGPVGLGHLPHIQTFCTCFQNWVRPGPTQRLADHVKCSFTAVSIVNPQDTLSDLFFHWKPLGMEWPFTTIHFLMNRQQTDTLG